jgi:hypothetical protein
MHRRNEAQRFQQRGKQKERQPGWTASQEKIDEGVKKIYPVGLLSIPAEVPLCDAAADRSSCFEKLWLEEESLCESVLAPEGSSSPLFLWRSSMQCPPSLLHALLGRGQAAMLEG